MRDRDWTCWQLLDSAFPSGGFAHSGGLETARAHGLSAGDLPAFLHQSLSQAAFSSAPFLRAAYEDPDTFAAIDARCDAFLTGHVANRASRRLGGAMLRACTAAFALPQTPPLDHLCRTGRTPGHFAVVFGAVSRWLELGLITAHEMFAYQTLRSLLSAATRLNVIGPLEAQGLHQRFSERARAIAHEAARLTADEPTQTSPLLEIIHGSHDRLYSRLFQS